jgi:hypothetical protein
MRTTLKLLLVLLAALAMLSFAACSDDDDDNGDNGGTNPTVPDPWVGDWLSAGENVAPLLAGDPFNLDSVRVHLGEDQVVVLEQHVEGGSWTTLNGTYAVTESQSGDVHSIEIIYPAFEQEGIIQVIEASPDTMLLEAVQVTPDIGAEPRTPETGFGSDPTLGTANIQTYVRVSQ